MRRNAKNRQRNKRWSMLIVVMASMLVFGCGEKKVDSTTDTQTAVTAEVMAQAGSDTKLGQCIGRAVKRAVKQELLCKMKKIVK